MSHRILKVVTLSLLFSAIALLGTHRDLRAAPRPRAAALSPRMQKRWLFIFRDMSDPKEVDRMIARFPRAQKDGYNGVCLGANVVASKAVELKQAAHKYGLDLIVMVMGGSRDRNNAEGILSKDTLFVARDGHAAFQPDNPTKVVNGDFENVTGNHFNGWSYQDDEGVTTFADHEVMHGGHTSLRMENVAKNPNHVCRITQTLKLQPHRQYRISCWVKSENLKGIDPNIEVLTPNADHSVSFGTFHTDPTQDWKHYDISFNSLDNTDARLYLGTWSGTDGKLWWDDISVEEIGLVNVLRRPGCPVTVKNEQGLVYEEGRDYQKIVDPILNPWVPYHDMPIIRFLPGTRIKDGERLRVSYYHPIIIYEDRVTSCLSEPKIFDEWRTEVETANRLLHPAGFFMEHDELRTINQCALCRSKHMTPGELLAENIRKSAQIIRDVRPDAEIWVWSDMFDPMHNAVDHFYAVDGSLAGSWKGLDKGIGIVNWNGGLLGKNCKFFADMGLKQILSGYYDGDEDGSAITKWIDNTKGIPGVVGAMYTTWADNYGAMDVWARKAWGTTGGIGAASR